MIDQDKADREQQKIRFGELARQVLENNAYISAWALRRGQLVQELTVLKKGKHYEAKLKDIHDSLQNLDALEIMIKKYYDTGKMEVSKRNRLFNHEF